MSIQELATLFGSNLLKSLVEDEKFIEDDQTSMLKDALVKLRLILETCNFKLITPNLILYFDSQILDNLYKLHLLAEVDTEYDSTAIILCAAGALELLEYYNFIVQEPDTAARLACVFDRPRIIKHLRKRYPNPEYMGHALSYDAAGCYAEIGEVSKEKLILNVQNNNPRISKFIADKLPDVKIRPDECFPQHIIPAIDGKDAYFDIGACIDKMTALLTVLDSVDLTGFRVKWTHAFQQACEKDLTESALILAEYAKNTQSGFDRACMLGNINTAEALCKAGYKFGSIDADEFDLTPMMQAWLKSVGLLAD